MKQVFKLLTYAVTFASALVIRLNLIFNMRKKAANKLSMQTRFSPFIRQSTADTRIAWIDLSEQIRLVFKRGLSSDSTERSTEAIPGPISPPNRRWLVPSAARTPRCWALPSVKDPSWRASEVSRPTQLAPPIAKPPSCWSPISSVCLRPVLPLVFSFMIKLVYKICHTCRVWSKIALRRWSGEDQLVASLCFIY